MKRTDWSLLSDALSRIERLESEDSGLLSFGLDSSGGIFVEEGQVCWAAARGRSARLRELLNEHARVDAASLDAAFERCRAERKPFGDCLVGQGLLQRHDLSRALRRHSAECLVELCRTSLPMRWTPHPGGYAAPFAFRPADLWLEAVGYCYPEQLERAEWELSGRAGSESRLVAFVLDADEDCLLPLAALHSPSVAELRTLAHFASTMPRVSLELAAAPMFTLACTEDGHAAVVWWKAGVLFTELCQSREGLAVAAARHLACA